MLDANSHPPLSHLHAVPPAIRTSCATLPRLPGENKVFSNNGPSKPADWPLPPTLPTDWRRQVLAGRASGTSRSVRGHHDDEPPPAGLHPPFYSWSPGGFCGDLSFLQHHVHVPTSRRPGQWGNLGFILTLFGHCRGQGCSSDCSHGQNIIRTPECWSVRRTRVGKGLMRPRAKRNARTPRAGTRRSPTPCRSLAQVTTRTRPRPACYRRGRTVLYHEAASQPVTSQPKVRGPGSRS